MNPQFECKTDTSRPMGEIAASSLGAIEVLERFRLDYCCDGGRTLADAAARAGTDVNRVVEQLEARRPVEPPKAGMGTGPLIQRIVDLFHARHRSDLPLLLESAERVEAVHPADGNTPRGLVNALERLHALLIPLMDREERTLFPAIRDGAAVADDVDAARRQRRSLGRLLHEIEQLTGNFAPPGSACRTWRRLYCEAARFAEALRYHTHLENNVLVPRLEREREQSRPVAEAHTP